ncbi:MAG: hypothetical protein JRI55_17875 [Deltaproteobacteria bacterium]|nr:hypothetical protein [Deltaproteobacteria bacterium]
MGIPPAMAWLFPEHEPSRLNAARDKRLILARVLEQGRMQDVRWCVRHYGLSEIHRFFREDAHPEISDKTVALWRVALRARDEHWRSPRRSRLRSVAPWPG